MADFSKPVTTDAYANVLTYLKATTSDLALGLDPATTTPTNVPTNSVRWNSASNKWQKYNGSTWADLAASYAINISGTAAGLSATLAIASGGTGATTAAAALVNMGERTGENGSTKLPTGTTAQRDGTPAAGYIRFNSDITKFEGYTGSAWASIADDAAVVTLTGNQTIAGTKTFSSSPVVPGLNGGQLAGMRNKIINGDMNIAQRGTSFAAATNGIYTADRWQYLMAAGAVETVSQQADAPSNNEFQNSLRLAVTTADTSIAAGEFSGVRQHIEGYNARDLIGKTFTLSFWVRSSKTGVHCVAFRNSGQDRAYVVEYTVNAANTWEYKSVAVIGGLITAGTWNWTTGIGLTVNFATSAGSTYQTTAGAWQTGNYLATSSQVNCLDTIGNIFAITGVQLEPGSVATPFEHRPYGAELALCQRYYCKTFPQGVAPVQAVGNNNGALGGQSVTATNGPWVTWAFPVCMRTSPTVTTYSPRTADAGWRDLANTVSNTVGTLNVGDCDAYIAGSAAATSANYFIHATATAEL